MKKNAAFTMVELSIVVVILSIVTGFLAKTWCGMEKISAASHRNLSFTFQSRNILDRISGDIRNSIQASRSDGALLELIQIAESGKKIKVRYFIEEKELIRDLSIGDALTQSVKIASLKDRFLDISFLKEGMIRIEIRRRPREGALELKNTSLSAYVCFRGDMQ